MIAVSEKYALEVGSPTPITSEHQHEEYLSVLDKLASKNNPKAEGEKYAEVLLALIETYEEEHHPIPDAGPVEVLRALMEANALRQKDLVPIFGSESIVSEILHKKRALSKTHIEKLSKRFRISPAAFFKSCSTLIKQKEVARAALRATISPNRMAPSEKNSCDAPRCRDCASLPRGGYSGSPKWRDRPVERVPASGRGRCFRGCIGPE